MIYKKMIRSILIGMFCFSHVAFAKTLICPFKDYFSIYGPENIQILAVTPDSNGNIKYTQSSNTFFYLSCGENNRTKSGDIEVSIGTDYDYQCTVTIHDGPYVMDPSVKTSHCKGNISYMGMDHVFGSYTYTLKFG